MDRINLIRKALLDSGITQSELAEILGKNKATISYHLNGDSDISKKTFDELMSGIEKILSSSGKTNINNKGVQNIEGGIFQVKEDAQDKEKIMLEKLKLYEDKLEFLKEQLEYYKSLAGKGGKRNN